MLVALQASKVIAHLKKRSAAAGEGIESFVWGKKIDKQIQDGISMRELTAKQGRDQLEERQVRVQPAPASLHSVAQLLSSKEGMLPDPCDLEIEKQCHSGASVSSWTTSA